MKSKIKQEVKKGLEDLLHRGLNTKDLLNAERITDGVYDKLGAIIGKEILEYVEDTYIISNGKWVDRKQTLKVDMSNLKAEFGKIVILEGDDDPFNEYNYLAKAFNEIYQGKDIVTHDRLYYMKETELITLFVDLLFKEEPITLVLNTTGTRKEYLNGLFDIAKRCYRAFLDKKSNHNIKYIIEQYNNGHFKAIAKELKIDYIGGLSFILDTRKEDNREVLTVDVTRYREI